jgi:hypothetical protein
MVDQLADGMVLALAVKISARGAENRCDEACRGLRRVERQKA